LTHDPPVLRVMSKQVPAGCYNHVRLALLRLGKPLRVALNRHRGLVMELDDEAWWCLDSLANDQRIMVWRAFAAHGRDDLTQPVACELALYHHLAGLVMGTVLGDLEQALELRLTPGARA
jgi:hypothetical protein